MRLIVGLGNPGAKYRSNRHNVGFMLLDQIADLRSLSFKKKIKYDYTKFADLILLKPKTYMNRSGNAVTSVLSRNKIEDILVIVDDINIPLGEIRLRRAGGFGGHNGLKSIGSALGTDNFKRLRIGVGAPAKEDLADFVLSDFSKNDLLELEKIFNLSKELIEEYVENDFDRMVEKYSRLKKSYSEKVQNSQDRNGTQA
jgi:peptidyl-tRNA hydrolase, PTH1 family